MNKYSRTKEVESKAQNIQNSVVLGPRPATKYLIHLKGNPIWFRTKSKSETVCLLLQWKSSNDYMHFPTELGKMCRHHNPF